MYGVYGIKNIRIEIHDQEGREKQLISDKTVAKVEQRPSFTIRVSRIRKVVHFFGKLVITRSPPFLKICSFYKIQFCIKVQLCLTID